MLRIEIPKTEFYSEATQEFVQIQHQTLQLEHSLISLSKWEAKWHKPFLSAGPANKQDKTDAEIRDYIRCMTLSQGVKPEIFYALTQENMSQIVDYINDPMTATTISSREANKPNRRIVTSELIYYWMVAYGIPFECEKWHLNRLMMLIRVCGEENKPHKKMSKSALMHRNAKLNAERRARLGSSG